jgi:hypothetical protein
VEKLFSLDIERYRVSELRQVEGHIAEPLVPKHSPSEVSTAVAI